MWYLVKVAFDHTTLEAVILHIYALNINRSKRWSNAQAEEEEKKLDKMHILDQRLNCSYYFTTLFDAESNPLESYKSHWSKCSEIQFEIEIYSVNIQHQANPIWR